jgi:hypothetical protein
LPEPAQLKGFCGAAHFQHDDAGRLRTKTVWAIGSMEWLAEREKLR